MAVLTGQLASGFNQSAGGYWNGAGIISSTAAADTTFTTALGMILNDDNGNTLYGSGAAMGLFDGQNPALTDVLIKYTYYGDANLSGAVDGTDYANIDNGFFTHATGWFNGDFDYNNAVDGSDYTLIDNTYNQQGASIAAQVAAAIAIVRPDVAAPPINPTMNADPNPDQQVVQKKKHATRLADLRSTPC
jgi:hypothetical protein